MWVFLTICLIGFAVLAVSFVLGEVAEHGGEIIHDVAVDHEVFDHGGEIDHPEGGPSIFSTRILAAFVTGFGGAGAICSHLGGHYLLSSLVGTGSGFVMAAIVYLIVSFLYKQQASSGIVMAELAGRAATVTIAIPKDGAGQITLTMKGSTVCQFAQSADGSAIPYGSTVTIQKVVGDKVIVGV